jgi:hypothetical protein
VAGLTIIVDGLGYGMKQFSGMSLPDVKLMMNSMEVSYQLYTGYFRGCYKCWSVFVSWISENPRSCRNVTVAK